MRGFVQFIYSCDGIFQAVKQESSLLAERRFDGRGESRFEELVFDEEYLIFFRRLFFDAQAKVVSAVSAYMRDVPFESEYSDRCDFSFNRDFILTLCMPDAWNFHLSDALDSTIEEFIVAYVLYRWLETKLMDESAIFLQRANAAIDRLQGLLCARTKIYRRRHGYWE